MMEAILRTVRWSIWVGWQIEILPHREDTRPDDCLAARDVAGDWLTIYCNRAQPKPSGAHIANPKCLSMNSAICGG